MWISLKLSKTTFTVVGKNAFFASKVKPLSLFIRALAIEGARCFASTSFLLGFILEWLLVRKSACKVDGRVIETENLFLGRKGN